MSKLNLNGQRFGKLVVINEHSEKTSDGRILWFCKCDCGGEKITRADHLKNNLVKSCGCLLEHHNLSYSSEYKIWDSIRQRCSNPKNKHYHHYGGRGITVCDEWKNSFEAFYRDMGPRSSDKHSIDRKRNNEGYNKDNCEWKTQKDQVNNTRRNLVFTYQGETKTLMQWCEILGFNYHNVKYRIHKGMLFEVAIHLDKIAKSNLLSLNNITKEISIWCKESRVTFSSFRYRLSNGWTFEEALTPIESKEITFSVSDLKEDEETHTLEWWCGLLGLDKDKTYLRILRGEEFEDIVKE